jgi:ABC-type Zn uptake system ZnuABC Zn-binding protein ZnuA
VKIFLKPFFALSIFLIAGLLACQQPAQLNNDKIRILTTIAPVYCFTKNVTEDAAIVDNLLPAGAGAHDYSFSPADIMKIQNADVIIINGVQLESWLDKVISSSGGKSVIIDTSDGIIIRDNDPHIWLSPRNAIVQVRNIMNALLKIDEENSPIYKSNAEDYIRKLGTLDGKIQTEIDSWKRKEFIAFHSAFKYFAEDYGLRQAAVIEEFPGKSPSPSHIAGIIDIIKSTDVNAIFTEPQAHHRIVESLARDMDLEVLTLDTMETGGLSREFYENASLSNLEALGKALK